MKTVKHSPAAAGALALLLALAACPLAATAQVVADEACPKYAVDIAAFATCDGDRVTNAEDTVLITADRALMEIFEYSEGVVLLDVRSRADAIVAGWATPTDMIVPFEEIAYPYRWDAQHGDLVRERNERFVAQVGALLLALGGDQRSRLLVLGRTTGQALQAAHELQDAGFRSVLVVEGGVEGEPGPDGHREGGWKDRHLPWTVSSNDLPPLGLRDKSN
jgi:rhodanese-related sulfurtransferase